MEELRFSDYCANCRKSLEEVEKILFVEKELGRCFCCEECIKDYFQPTVDFMEEELQKLRSVNDFQGHEALKYAHYRALTLGDPDEVWLDVTESGERHFTFITHFRHGEERLSYIVVCLAIDGVPSFVFISFPTRDEDLVDEYRRGAEIRIQDESDSAPEALPEPKLEIEEEEKLRDAARLRETEFALIEESEEPVETSEAHGRGQAQEGTYFERLYSELRQAGDIPREVFDRFEMFVEPTLDDPDEIWKLEDEERNEWCTFISKHELENPEEEGDIDEFVMIVVCQAVTETTETGQAARSFEVIFAFPTIDPALVQHFRKGINSLNKAFGVGWTRGRAA